MRRILEDRRLTYALVLCVFLAGGAVSAYLYHLDEQKQLADMRDHVVEQASAIRVSIEQQVNTSLNLTKGLVIYVATHPDLNQTEFEFVAGLLLERAHYIQNIGLAKNNVISHLYPLQGNRKALGLRYFEMPSQRAAVIRAIEAKDSVIAGPVALVQGGHGFISRIPIFLDKQQQRYWGLASVVMNVDAFFKEAEIDRYADSLDIALRGRDSLGEAGEVFYGDAGLFASQDSVRLPIALPQGSWLLAARLRDYSHGAALRPLSLLGIGIGISLLLSLLLYVLLDLLRALSRANRRAEQASAQKSRFFTQMTHELRTPLTAIQGVVGLLASGVIEPDSPKSGELLDNALRNCQRLQWLVNDALDLKKLESGTASLVMHALPVADLIADAVDGVAQIARQYGIEISREFKSEEALCVSGDRERLLQVMNNLLSNAIKFSPEHGHVTIRAYRQGDTLRLEVIDQGRGVSADKLAAIFEEFNQDSPSNRPGIASTGLGLSISKQIIELHGGTIGCRNISTGGCCFYIELPLAGKS